MMGFHSVAAAQSTAVAAVSVKPDMAAPPAHTGRATASRTKPDKPATRYFIEFRSRNALSYGHAYVVYGRLDPHGKMIDPQVGGIHPASTNTLPELEASTPVWHAVLYSCISFVSDIAKFMGMRTPPTGMYPEVFINNLRAMNSGSDEEITLIPRVQWGLAPGPPPPE